MKDKPTISLCMIVKDEENFLEWCLENAKFDVDEIIIVDTGSKDLTIDIAKKFGAKIFHHKWNNDFSEARNVSLKHATKDWILVLDADEMISKDDLKKIRELIEDKDVDAYSLINRNYFKSRKPSGLEISSEGDNYIESRGYDGWFPSRLVILFRNHKRYEYNYVIHELVEDSINKLGGNTKHTEIAVHHYRCDKSKEFKDSKKKDYLLMAKKQLDSTPDNPKFHYGVGSMYFADNKIDLAIESLEESLKIIEKSDNPEKYSQIFKLANYFLGMAYLRKKLYQKASNCFESIESFYKDSGQMYLYRAQAYQGENRFKDAIRIYKELIELNPKDPEPRNNLGNLYSKLGLKEEAIDQLKLAVEFSPKNAIITRNLAAIYYSMKKYSSAYEYFKKAIQLNPQYKEDLKEVMDQLEKLKNLSADIDYSFTIG